MSDILVGTFIVSCRAHLLLCDDVDTRGQVFADMGKCQTILQQIVSEYRQDEGLMKAVMGRCRYLLDENDESKRHTLRYTADSEHTF